MAHSPLIGGFAVVFVTQGGAHAPPSQPQQRPAAVDAAYGTPPQGATFDPSTRSSPGWIETPRNAAPDQSYGAQQRGTDAEGQPVSGYQVYDESVFFGEGTAAGPQQEFHVVQEGDTLWDISSYYLRDPYLWPKLWSYNNHITNAHWIFPGDRVRLTDPYGREDDGSGRIEEGAPDLRYNQTPLPLGRQKETYMLNQFAYVDAKAFELAMEVIGGSQAKSMMATLDTLYMDYEDKRPPIPGERLVVYTPQESVYDPESKDLVGYVVQVVGEVEIEKVATKAAEGTVADSFNPIERGYKVGPLRRKFRRIDTIPGDEAVSGTVIASVNSAGYVPDLAAKLKRTKRSKRQKSSEKERRRRKHKDKDKGKPNRQRRIDYATRDDVLSGEDQFVIVNLGADDGIKVGNVLEIIRKGDEYTDARVFKIPYEDGWPRRLLGTVLVVDVQEQSALCAVTFSRREVEIGDHVELVGPNGPPRGTQDEGRRRSATGQASATGEDGQVEGKVEGSMTVGGKR